MQRSLNLGWFLATIFAVAACGTSAARQTARTRDVDTPGSYLAVSGGKIWYRVTGTGSGTPVILLHGGPGLSSFYLKSLEALGDDRRVVRYDQLGSGKSDHVSDTTMFNVAHFVRELDSLRRFLGYDRVNLYGHSWGAILAVEYYRAYPEHVVSLTLASAALDIPAWHRNSQRLLKTLPDSMQRAVKASEATGRFDTPGYQAAVNEFAGRYVWHTPVQADLDSIMSTANDDISNYMQGPSEFTVTGTMKDYDATGFLKQIRAPVLYTVGADDEADTTTVKGFAAATPGARVVVIPNAAHMTMWDNPTANLGAVRDFLRQVDSSKTKH